MNRYSLSAFTASLLLHSAILTAAPTLSRPKQAATRPITVELLEIASHTKVETPVEQPKAKPEKKKISPPRLLSKPEIESSEPLPPPTPEPQRAEALDARPDPRPLSTPPEPASADVIGAHKTAEAEGIAGGDNNASLPGDLADGVRSIAGGGSPGEGSRDSQAVAKTTAGHGSNGVAISSPARPSGGYQIKPRYPESARRAGAEGTTLLKVQVLVSGRVGEILIEKSAGHHELDNAAAEAVKKWVFEPARAGDKPVTVWVLLPVKFELH